MNKYTYIYISLSSNYITSIGAAKMFNSLIEFNSISTKSIEFVDVSKNQIDDDCMVSLGHLLKNNHFIKGVDFSNYSLFGNNKITDKGIEILRHFVKGNNTLISLDVSHNKGITDKSTPLLFEIIENSNIESIKINGTEIANKNIFNFSLLGNKLKNNSISSLDLLGW